MSRTDTPRAVLIALQARVADLERSQQDEDIDGFLSLFTADAVWVTGGGRRLIGAHSIREFTQAVLPGAFADGGTVTYSVTHVVMVAEGVALTSVDQHYFDSEGMMVSAGRPTYLWVLEDDEWRILSGQNTVVSPD